MQLYAATASRTVVPGTTGATLCPAENEGITLPLLFIE